MSGGNMWRMAMVCLLLAALSVPALALEPGEDTLDVTVTRHYYKDPVDAFKLALFPGFLLHGRGTIYAGQREVGATLLAGEAVSCLAMMIGVWERSDPDFFKSFPGNNDSETVAESSGTRLLYYGAIGFAVSWVVDMVYAPQAAKRYNAEHGLTPSMELSPRGIRVALGKSF